MRKINCDIIEDLLPSYSDKITSEATNQLVEEHLQKCENCRSILEGMNKDIDIKILNKDEQIDYLKGYKKRKKIIIALSILTTIIILATIFIIDLSRN